MAAKLSFTQAENRYLTFLFKEVISFLLLIQKEKQTFAINWNFKS